MQYRIQIISRPYDPNHNRQFIFGTFYFEMTAHKPPGDLISCCCCTVLVGTVAEEIDCSSFLFVKI